PAPRLTARRREPEGRSRLPPGAREPGRAGKGRGVDQSRRGRAMGARVARRGVPGARPRLRPGVAAGPRGRAADAGGSVGCNKGDGMTERRKDRTTPSYRPSVVPSFRRSSNSSISGGTNTRIGTPTTPIPRLTYSWLLPRWKCPITYFVINRPADQPSTGR